MVEIREACKSDAYHVAAVLMTAYSISTLDEGAEAFLTELSKKHGFLIAVADERVVGLTSFKTHGLPKHGLSELDRIAVLPEFRRHGVAKELFGGTVKQLKKFYEEHNCKLRKLYLLTHQDNKGAQEFYKKLGFTEETILKDHYYENKPEIVMSMFF